VKSLFDTFQSGADMRTLVDDRLARKLTQSATDFRTTFNEANVTMGNVIEKGDRIAFRYTRAGVDKKTNKRVQWHGSAVARVVNGKIADIQVMEDHWGLLIDQGIIPTLPQDDISGDWSGSLFGIPFSLDLTEAPNSTKVTGTLSVPALNLSVAVSGTNNPAANPDVQLSGSASGQTITFTGNWNGANEIDGTINGAGFSNQAVEINR
jgi:hypothetical protein